MKMASRGEMGSTGALGGRRGSESLAVLLPAGLRLKIWRRGLQRSEEIWEKTENGPLNSTKCFIKKKTQALFN